MKKIVLAGGSGFLGTCLVKYFLQLNYEIVVLSRKNRVNEPKVKYVKWDGKNLGYWANHLEGAHALINLNGKSVDCRYNEQNKQLIYDSRIDSTYILGEAIQKLKSPPRVWINASSATIYRHALDIEMEEETGELGEGFSVDVCKKWEATFNSIQCPKTRKVVFRIAIVLGKNDGALKPLVNLARIGMGGKQGKGNQFFSWIHEKDFCQIVHHAMTNENIQGVYNVSSPEPIPNDLVMKELRRRIRMPFGLSMPEWLLSIGALLIQTETELILKSRRVVPQRLMNSGYKFTYPNFKDAIDDLITVSS